MFFTAAALSDWFTTSWPALGGAVVSSVAAFVLVIAYTRLTGVRSFTKMSGIDFAMTIAVGSVLAATAMSAATPLPLAAAVLAVLFGGQRLLAFLRVHSDTASRLLDNRAILVMAEGRFLEDNMKQVSVTRDELIGKLREANVLEMCCVRAVVVETTGDVSVLHGEPSVELADELFEGVRDGERYGEFAAAARSDNGKADA